MSYSVTWWYYREGGSDKHLRDVAAMLQVSGSEIDKGYISHWAQQLNLTEEWQAVVDRLPGKSPSGDT